jgi:hyaluronan synthase
MFTFLRDALDTVRAGTLPTPFMVFFVYVWIVWTVKAVTARRYRPSRAPVAGRASVIVAVYNEPEVVFRRSLASVVANRPAELVVVVDGGDPGLAAIARDYADQVLRVPKAGKREAIATGLRHTDPATEVVVVLDSDTVWAPDALRELLRPFSDPRVGGVAPHQSIFDALENPVRRLADWIEDIRHHLTIPAQSVYGQVGCLSGRTIAYRRAAFEPAVERLVRQTVLGVRQHVGDDRVLTSELLRAGWRTVYQSTARVETDAPSAWRPFWRQQLRWGRSSQRETLLSLGWLWRRPMTFVCFLTDIVTPFALYAVLAVALARGVGTHAGRPGLPLPAELLVGYLGMILSIGVRQAGHVRRRPADLWRLPLFVLQLTCFMVPIRIVAFATMFHQGWTSRSASPVTVAAPHESPAESASAA